MTTNQMGSKLDEYEEIELPSGKIDFVSLTFNELNPMFVINKAKSNRAGAVSSFFGTTRDNFEGKIVTYLEYEAYTDMALGCMKEICNKARLQWDLINIIIQHKLGSCPIGDISVGIVISSAHRNESLSAVQFVIDELKKTVPIWKKEFYSDGDNTWKENQTNSK
eukprot:gene15571-21026_t